MGVGTVDIKPITVMNGVSYVIGKIIKIILRFWWDIRLKLIKIKHQM